jgi:putative component of membrane protein insertase Oxa1/YidC/SpoIIIJ protein YidD
MWFGNNTTNTMKIVFPFILFCFSLSLSAQSFMKTSGEIAFSFYHNIMSPIKAPVSKCQFYPSCSKFSKSSIEKFGFIPGILMTADRLIRCSGGHLKNSLYPEYNNLLYDPPEENFIFAHEKNRKNESTTLDNKNSIVKFENNNFGFAKYLFNERNYDLSILELKRISFFTEDTTIKKKTNLLIALNCLQKNHFDCARNNIENLTFSLDVDFDILVINFLINDSEGAYNYNENYLKNNLHQSKNKKHIIQKFLVYNFLKSEKIESAINSYRLIQKYENFENINKNLDFIDDFKNLSLKSPAFAGIISALIPGSGYIYSGELKEGFSALIINGLLAWGIYSLFDNNNTGSGILTSMIALPFYLGNIVGSANAAMLYNNNKKDLYFIRAKKELSIDFYFSMDYFNTLWE